METKEYFKNSNEILAKLQEFERNWNKEGLENLKSELIKYSTFNIKQLFENLSFLINSISDDKNYEYNECIYYEKKVLVTGITSWKTKDVTFEKEFNVKMVIIKGCRYFLFTPRVKTSPSDKVYRWQIIHRFKEVTGPYVPFFILDLDELNDLSEKTNKLKKDKDTTSILNFDIAPWSFSVVRTLSSLITYNMPVYDEFYCNYLLDLIRHRYNNDIEDLKTIDLYLFTKEFIQNNYDLLPKVPKGYYYDELKLYDKLKSKDEILDSFQKKLIYNSETRGD